MYQGTTLQAETTVVNSSRRRIVIVDDDVALRDSLKEQLDILQEFDLDEAGTAAGAMDAVAAGVTDLVILDVNLPDGDGRDVCLALREAGYKGPVIMLTARDGEHDTVRGLDSGANDYVTKPFRFNVLLARIRAQLRQHEQSEEAVFRIGPYTFKPASKVLIKSDNKKVRLTEKESNILKFLYRSGQQVVGRETLLNEVWGYNPAATTHTLETHIYRLRQKIELNPSQAKLLVTEPGGYKLVP
ncbi:MAG: response regulator transcription factor [Hyphomicrobiales bacterium]